MLQFVVKPLRERLGPVESEYWPAAGIGLKQICEAGFYASALVQERQRPAGTGNVIWNAFAVLLGLNLNPGQRLAPRLASTTPAAAPSKNRR